MITQPSVASQSHIQVDVWWLLAVGSVVASVLAASILSPDMVTGSSQEHLPLAAFTDWIWGAVAIGYLAFVRGADTSPTLSISVTVLWLAVAVASIAAPELVTGTDPTRIPLAALVAPVVGTIVTGFLTLHAAITMDSR